MSNHNYSQYSNKNKRDNATNQKPYHKPVEKVEREIVEQPTTPVVNLVQETVETVALPSTVKGVVAHCAKLNVRENTTVDSGIVCVLDVMSEVEIDVSKSTENWYYICSATGAEGYCMKQYVDAHM